MTQFMDQNFGSLESSQADSQPPTLHLVQLDSSNNADNNNFILINHDESNNQHSQRQPKMTEKVSSNATKLDKNVPVVNLHLGDFTANLRAAMAQIEQEEEMVKHSK